MLPARACTSSTTEHAISPAAVSIPRRRRSRLSESAPPYSPKTTSGTSWNSPTRPTTYWMRSSADCVIPLYETILARYERLLAPGHLMTQNVR